MTAGCVERKERTRCINILIMKRYHINFIINIKNIKMLISVHNCSEKISYLFQFIRFSTLMYTHYVWVNWCSCAMMPWKKVVLIFLHQNWLGLAVMGKYHTELRMFLNLAFLMKCKYNFFHAFFESPIATLRKSVRDQRPVNWSSNRCLCPMINSDT